MNPTIQKNTISRRRWSSGLIRHVFRIRSWMRKVVGSNPGEANNENRLFFCGVEDRMEGSNGRIECDLRSAVFEEQEVVRINLLRLVEPSTRIIVRILIVVD